MVYTYNGKVLSADQGVVSCEQSVAWIVFTGSLSSLLNKIKEKMNKLVYGVGVNDLGYRVHVYEELPKKWRQKSPEACFYMQILYSVEKHAKKMLQQKISGKLPNL